jgi:hypothetical protein
MDVEQARQKADELIQKIQDDADFRAQFEADPAGTVKAAGLPENVAPVIHEAGTAEVKGYATFSCGLCRTGTLLP